ncbi:hypothetical protein SAMN04488008_101369 [Maribacter orientalis]|uniref:Uncharacterized protein n=1 Tax=Maribacter orientalis TaxID=228957 RepID=A0A1H7GMS9_9FLAO|nr:hypothetical protein SAMN04488008_101369 [Maribacter orientalis]
MIWFLTPSVISKKITWTLKKLEFKVTISENIEEYSIHGNKIYLKNAPELIVDSVLLRADY